MSILIKGMNMPYSCADCDFCSGLIMPDDIYTCECDAGEIAGTDITKYVEAEEPTFPEWCPIADVPTPHGRLIDADNFIDRVKADVGMVEEDLSFEFKDGIWSVLKLLETQPTVAKPEG